MTDERKEAPAAEPLSPWVLLGWVSALSGPIAYAIGRLVAETFYGRFGVLPGEVGLSYGALVAPALVVVVLTALLGTLVIRTGQAVVAVGFVGLATALAKLNDLDLRGIVFLGAGLVVLGMLWLIGRLTTAYGRPFWVASLCLLVLAAGGLALRTAGGAADRVSRGEEVRLSLLGLPLTTIKATRVRLTGVQTQAALPKEKCLVLLGSSAGAAVLVDGPVVWRVPTDSAMTSSGC
ncbi:hypothetical protein [Lentzea sp. NPDC060358]|uniref:hypothetical protein n=1 Tax=Lentzea sp. NPDC060358 TaxID=3347103 RepID=UPI003651CB18